MLLKYFWRRAWQPTPVFLPGESFVQRSLMGYSPQSQKESDITEWLSTHTHSTHIVDLQCRVNYCYTAKPFIYTHIHMLIHTYILFHILFHYGLLHDNEFSISLCCTVRPYSLPILYVIVYISNPKLPLHPSPTCLPLGNHKSVLYVCEAVSVSLIC